LYSVEKPIPLRGIVMTMEVKLIPDACLGLAVFVLLSRIKLNQELLKDFLLPVLID
jgi:hypothetical protein